MINSVRTLVVWKTALRVSRTAGRGIRQDAGCSPLEAGAPRRATRVHHSCDFALEKLNAIIQSAIKRFFFTTDRFLNRPLLRPHFRKNIAHRLRDNVNELEEERFVKA